MTYRNVLDPPRWQNYVLEHGPELEEFLQSHLSTSERDVLFVLGRGFDPRMCLGLKLLLRAGGIGRRDVLAIEFHEGTSSPSRVHAPLVEANWAELQSLLEERTGLSTKPVRLWSNDGRRIGSRSAAALFDNLSDLVWYTDVFVDISAMPRGIYFPLIAKLLYLLDSAEPGAATRRPNLYVLVSEDPLLDELIHDEGIDDTAAYVYPFSGGLEMEATAGYPRVWIPLLGEGQVAQLGRIYDLVLPDEICPVLPSPSLNPRRGDDLVLEYRGLLFDQLRVDPRNFIYASERNPFEVYRQIRRAILQYGDALRPLGDSKAVISALSTKLLSVGALLVAYELKQAKIEVGIAHVEAQGYVMSEGADARSAQAQSVLFGLWLSGDCYES
jgi:hypothetical protein